MRLWETYFRLWNKISDDLNKKSASTETGLKEKSIQGEDKGKEYFGLDEKFCLECGV